MPRTNRREKRAVIATGLSDSFAGRASGQDPFKIVGKFRTTSGPATVSDGRETIVHLTGTELASLLGAVPALCFTDEPAEVLKAYHAVTSFLERLDTRPDPRNEYS
jgi:hypothetical protein